MFPMTSSVRGLAGAPSLLLLAALLPVDADAVVHCVDTAGELQSALIVAAGNGVHDEIRVSAGTYPLTARLSYSSSQNFDLVVDGGWTPLCDARVSMPSATVIDGTASTNGIVAWTPTGSSTGDLTVRNLTFTSSSVGTVNAVQIGNYAAALWTGDVLVENVVFRDIAVAGTADYAVAIEGGAGTLLVRNNLFTGNRMGRDNRDPQRVLSRNQTSVPAGVFSGNTVSGNLADAGTTNSTGALSLQGFGRWLLVNNILWGNDGADLAGSASAALVSNDIGVRTLSNVSENTANVSVDPRFDAELRLLPDSPLIDVGEPTPAGGIGSDDAFGQRRLSGLTVDLGAFEFPRIFADGFDP